VPGISRHEKDPETFHVDWAALHGGVNPWKRTHKIVVDPLLVAKAVKAVMRKCPLKTAAGKPLVWNEYRVFLDLDDWDRIKKLEGTLLRDLGEVVEKALKKSKAEMVGSLNIRLLRDEGGTVRPGMAVVKVDFSEVEPPAGQVDASEMTIRIGGDVARSLTDLTQRVPESFVGAFVDPSGEDRLRVLWEGGEAKIRSGSRVVLGRPHGSTAPGFIALDGANTKINKRQLWIEASDDGALIGRLSDANPVEVKGRLVQAGGQISIDSFPAEISLSSGEMKLTLDRFATT
jgi:hypothetical protein